MRIGDLVSAGVEPAGEPVIITFEGQPLPARAGESLAATLAASGILDLRQSSEHERRGVFCGMGACQECLVEIDGRGSQRACMTKVDAGMAVRRHDPQQAQLAPLAPAHEGTFAEEACDVAIIGAGPAGLMAARVLAEAGLRPVIVDERDQPGGQFYKQLAPSYRFRAGGEDDQFTRGRRLIEEVRARGVDIRSSQTVWHAVAEDDKVTLGVQAADRAYLLSAKAVLIATGAYELPVHIPGWTLPGVMTSGAAQTLARAYRVTPGQKVLVAGNGPLNWQLALEIARGGGKVVAVVESGRPGRAANVGNLVSMARHAPGLAGAGIAMRLELARRAIPLIEGHRVSALEGNQRVERAHIVSLADATQGRTLDADIVCLGYGFTPTTELARMLGVEVSIDARTGLARPRLEPSGRAGSLPVWIAGDAAGIGGSQVALAQGASSGKSIARWLGKPCADDKARDLARARGFQHHLWAMFAAPDAGTPIVPETTICRCETVSAQTIIALRESGVRDLGSLKRQTRLGMGRCQGRYCAGAALKLLRHGALDGATEADLFAPQAPAKPIPANLIISEKAEWGGHAEVETGITPKSAVLPDPLPERCELLVIGAGITGASTAMFAAREGVDVVVIDRSAPNSQASGGNAGSLHVQLLSWDFGKKAMSGGHPALMTLPLQRDSVALWKALEKELGADFEIVTTGGLMVAENADQTEFLRNKAAAEKSVGIDVEVIGASDLRVLAPAVSERMVVAAYCAAEGKINPLRATPAIVAEAMRCGARFAGGHDVVAIETDANGYLVTTGAGTIRAKRLVIAAGGWSRHLGAMLGVDLPISGAPLQMLVTEPTRPILKQLIAHADRHLTMKQASNGNLLIGGAWTAGINARTGYSRVLRPSIEGNLWVAQRTVPQVSGLHLLRSWAAMNINIDGAPLLGPLPGHPNVFVAATANGFTLGPIMGRLTADLATGRQPGRALTSFTLERFN